MNDNSINAVNSVLSKFENLHAVETLTSCEYENKKFALIPWN